MSTSSVAIVGAGSLGQPFGYYLAQGGAKVTYIVKEKYASDAKQGFTLHEWGLFGRPTTHEFADFDVVVDYEELERHQFDQLWLCLPSPAIRGHWLTELLEAVGSTTLVSIQPGLRDRNFLEEQYPSDRIVSVRVSLVAYPTPLPGEDLPEGDIAFIMPPGERIWVGGAARARNHQVSESLEAGGCSSGVRGDVRSATLRSSALMETTIAGLEVAGWNLSAFRHHPVTKTVSDAAKQALEVVAAYTDTSVPITARLATGRLPLSWGLSMGNWAAPFDLEAYLKKHFTKVGDQTRAHLEEWIEIGRERDCPVSSLQTLRNALRQVDHPQK